MLALIENGDTFLKELAEGQTFKLPDGRSVSPAEDGWSIDNYTVKTIVDPGVPDGQEATSKTVVVIAGVPEYAYVTNTLPTDDELDDQNLNGVLIAEGSVFRGVVEVLFDEINKLRVINGDAAYTKAQFKAAIKAKMRT